MTAAMVLAAGRGQRMRPLTAMTPKPLIEVCGRALFDHVVDRLEDGGIARYVVNVHYLADLMEVHARRRLGDRVTISDERAALLETGGGVVRALPHLGEDPFVVANSDTFWIEGASRSLPRLLAAFDGARMDAVLLLAPTVRAVGYSGPGDFDLDTNGRLDRRRGRTVAPFVYAGCGVFSPAAFAGAPEGRFSLNIIFDRLLAAGRLYGIRLDGLFIHVGTPSAIREAERAIAGSAA